MTAKMADFNLPFSSLQQLVFNSTILPKGCMFSVCNMHRSGYTVLTHTVTRLAEVDKVRDHSPKMGG